MKSLINYINEAKFKPNLNLNTGDEFYGIVCTMSERLGENARNMKPVKFEVTDIKHHKEKFQEYDEIVVKTNPSKINVIYIMKTKNWDYFWNGQGYIDENSEEFYLFCAKSLEDLQKLMNSEVGDKIESNLKEISKLAKDINNIQEKIKNLQEENKKLENNAKIDLK